MLTLLAVMMMTPQAVSLPDLLQGSWLGTLEYRDYRSDRRVTLPTALTVTARGTGLLEYAYVYDDGPGKTVRSTERVTIDTAASTYRVQNDEGYDATFAMTNGPAANEGTATFILNGTGTENDAPVDLKITVTVSSRTLTMLRESKRAGEDWNFRNRYS